MEAEFDRRTKGLAEHLEQKGPALGKVLADLKEYFPAVTCLPEATDPPPNIPTRKDLLARARKIADQGE